MFQRTNQKKRSQIVPVLPTLSPRPRQQEHTQTDDPPVVLTDMLFYLSFSHILSAALLFYTVLSGVFPNIA